MVSKAATLPFMQEVFYISKPPQILWNPCTQGITGYFVFFEIRPFDQRFQFAPEKEIRYSLFIFFHLQEKYRIFVQSLLSVLTFAQIFAL
jgi:hypothetical protein